MKKTRNLFVFILLMGIIILHSQFIIAADTLNLKNVLELSLQNNSEIVKSNLDREIAVQDLKLALKNLYPDISLQSSYTRLEEAPMTLFGEGSRNNYSTKITLTQPVYAGGKIRLGIDQAEKGLELAKVQDEKQMSDTLFKVIQAYYNVIMARDRVNIEKEALELVKEHHRMAKVSYEVGTAIKTDLLQVEIEESKAEQSVLSAQNQLWLARQNLANMIGVSGDFNLAEPELEPELDMDFDKLYQQALVNRSELKTLTLNREMIETNLEIEKKSHMPNVNIIGNYSWQGDEFSLKDGSWDLTVAGSISLFSGGKSTTKKDKIKKNLEKLKVSENNLNNMLELEIRQKMMEIGENQQNVKIQKMNLNKAEENLRLEEKRFEAGVGRSIDVLNAQTTLKQTKIALSQSEYRYEQSLFDLLASTGNLLDYVRGIINNE